MISDLRIDSMHAGKAAAWLKMYEQYGLPAQGKYFGEPVMFPTTEVGPLNQVIRLWKYESRADHEKRRDAMTADTGWTEYLKRNAKVGAIMSRENRILKTTAFSALG